MTASLNRDNGHPNLRLTADAMMMLRVILYILLHSSITPHVKSYLCLRCAFNLSGLCYDLNTLSWFKTINCLPPVGASIVMTYRTCIWFKTTYCTRCKGFIERPSAAAADPILSLSETLGAWGVSGSAICYLHWMLCKWFACPYTLDMDASYSEITVNGVSFDHIQCIWTPLTVNSL